MGNLDSLTRMDWNRELPGGLAELLETYEAAISQFTAEIRHLLGELHKQQGERSANERSQGESPRGYEDLAHLVRRLGLDQK